MAKNPAMLRNQFMNATKDSMSLFAAISSDVNYALNGPAGFPDLYTYYHSHHTAFMNAYDEKKSQQAIQKGSTETLTNMLKALTGVVSGWALNVEVVYKRGTPEYTAIFPKGRVPFNSGRQIDRISAIRQLSLNLTGITPLVSVKTSVDAYYTSISSAIEKQRADKSTTNTKSRILEECWQNACVSLYYVQASLMQMFNNSSEAVANYIPYHLLDRSPQKIFTGKLPQQGMKIIARRTVKPDALIDMDNTGNASYMLYWAESKEGILPEGTIPFTLGPGLTARVASASLGSVNNKFLTIRNTSNLMEADWSVQLP